MLLFAFLCDSLNDWFACVSFESTRMCQFQFFYFLIEINGIEKKMWKMFFITRLLFFFYVFNYFYEKSIGIF